MGGCDDLAKPVAITPDDARPAIVTDLNVKVNEDGSVTIDVEADDPNGEAMTLMITTPPQHGTAVLEDHRAQEAAVARTVPLPPKRPFEVIAEERRGEISEPPARAPPDAAPHQAAAKDGPATQAAAIHAAVRLVSGAESRNGQAVLVGRIRYTPEADFNGVDRLAFTVRNTSGFASEAETTLTVIAEPDAPRIDQSLADINLAPGQRITLNLRTEKVFADGDALSFSALSRDAAIATAEVTGDEVLTVQALNAPNQATVSVTIRENNRPPEVSPPDPQNNTEGEAVSLQIQATDFDTPLHYTASGLPPGLNIDTKTGEISGVIDLEAGNGTPYAVEVTVADDQTGATSVSFDWFVDHPEPTLDSLSPTSATQGTTLDVMLTGSNFIDGVSSVSFSGTGITINTTTINSDTEIVVHISIDAAAATGDQDVTVTNAGPGGGASATQTFTVTM